MTNDQRIEADEYSMTVFGRTNVSHYYDILTNLYASFATLLTPECCKTTYGPATMYNDYDKYGIFIVVCNEDPGLIDHPRDNDEYPAFVHILVENNGEYVNAGMLNLTGPAPKTPKKVIEYLNGEYNKPKLSLDIKEKIVKWANDNDNWGTAQYVWEASR
jgi:hypothetical protein